jgi:hypothetical protein
MKPNAAGLIARIGFTLVAVAIFIGTVSAAQPINITVQNYSFETPVTTDYTTVRPVSSGGPGLSGWNIYGDNSYVVKNGGGTVNYSSGVVGNQALFLEPWVDGSDTNPVLNPHLWQNVSAKFARGTYTLSVNAGMGSGYATLAEEATAEFQLLAYDGSKYNYNLGVAPTSVLVKNYNGYLNTFNYTLNLTGTESFIGNDIAIFLKAYKNGSTFQNVSYDNVQLTYTPPVNHVYNGDFQISPQNGYSQIPGWTQVPNPTGVSGFPYLSGGQIGSGGDVGVGAWDNGYVPGTSLSTNAVAFIETFNPQATLSLTQTVTGLTPGQMYELSYYENGRADSRVNPTTAETFVGGVSLVAAHLVQPVDTIGVYSNAFVQRTAQFTATAESMVLEFRATQLNGNDSFLVIDNVSIVAVPEPSTLILSTAGLIGLLATAWRKR